MPTSHSQRHLSYVVRVLLFFITIGTTVRCSGARPLTPSSSPTTPASARNSWLCASAPRITSLQELGVPADSRPVDVALSQDKVTVLLRPARVVSFGRENLQAVDMIVGQEGDSWRAIDRDPTDGSLWIVSEENVDLLRVSETGERTLVAGPKVEGRGGFYQIRISTDAIYTTPTGAANAVWRLSREGKLLGQAFPQPKEEEHSSAIPGADVRWGIEGSSGDFLLARDFGGNVVGLDRWTGQLYRANADGNWVSLPDRFPGRSPSRATSLHGEAVGTPSESWSFTGVMNSLLFLPEGPAVLGSPSFGLHSAGGTIARIKKRRVETAIEDCAGWLVVGASDFSGFAAVSAGSTRRESSGMQRILAPRVIVGRFHAGD